MVKVRPDGHERTLGDNFEKADPLEDAFASDLEIDTFSTSVGGWQARFQPWF